jgi:hypothetical protein
MKQKTVLYVCEDVPVPNTAGHTTYINAFLRSLMTAGYGVHVLVTGNHFPGPIFRFSKAIALPGVKSRIPQAWCLGGDLYIAQPLGLLKWVYRKFAKPWVQAIKAQKTGNLHPTVVHIGRWLKPEESKRLAARVANLQPDLVFIDTVLRSPILEYLPAGSKTVLVGHDIFYQRCQSLIASGLKPMPCIGQEEESAALRRFDALIGITPEDAAAYTALCSQTAVVAVLASPVRVPTGLPMRQPTQHIFYLGSQGHVNVDGLNWFLHAVWPTVKLAHPALVLDVVGSVGAHIQCDDPAVHIHGRVDDIAALATQAMFAINPVRAGSGLKIKMLDYFAHGLGCITTTVGAAGFPHAPDRPIAVCDDAAAFAATLLAWASDLEQCRQLSTSAQRYVQQFSSDAFAAGLQDLIARTTGPDAESTPRRVAP